MRDLPFKKVAQIQQICSKLPLDGLALILTGQSRNGGVLAYIEPKPSFAPPDEWQTKGLSELRDEDFLAWDGLAIGYDPLSLSFPLLLTQGVNFYSIRYLFAALNRLDMYRENARKLAAWLYPKESVAELSSRFLTKLIELLAPSWLESARPATSVGLALDSTDLAPFLTEEKHPRWVTFADLEKAAAFDGFLLTFEEIRQIIPTRHQESLRVIEWRPILWKNGQQKLLIAALEETARKIWEYAEKYDKPILRSQAYALALEKWLVQTDTEHLVAVFPHGDFTNFLKTGSAVFVKQTPKIYIGAEHPQEIFTLIDMLNRDKKLQETVNSAYGAPPFCIEPLLKSVQALTASSPAPLETVLYAAGKAPSLAAALLKLVNDFMQYENVKSAQFSPEQVRRSAIKGAYLLAFGDPWHAAWRGRFSLLLEQAYAILDDALLYDEKARQSQESRLLRRWYALYQAANLAQEWNELRQLAQQISEGLSHQEKYILDVLAGQDLGPLEIYQGGDLEPLISWGEEIPTLSAAFLRLYHEWHEIHQKRLAIERNLVHTSHSNQEVEGALMACRRLQRRLYALPHELAVLRYLCSEDVRALERLQKALQKQVALHVQMLTGNIFQGDETRLLFEVRNIGSQEARNVTFLLQASPQYEIFDEYHSQQVPPLPAHTGSHRIEWRIRTQEDTESLHIRLESNISGIQESFDFNLPVIRPSESRRSPRSGNPFQAGVAVDGEKFFGRQAELKSIFDLLLYGTTQPILLRGPRRIGKTSILHQIRYLLTTPGALQKWLGYSRENEMQLRLVKPVFTTLQGIRNEQDIPGWYFDLYQKIIEVTGAADVGYAIERASFSTDPKFVFERFITKLMNDHPELRLVILLDEWDEQRHLAHLGGSLRALIQSEKRLNWVIASTWMLSAEHGRFGSPFYGQTKSYELREMTWQDAKTMVETLSERADIIWKGEALVTLLDQTALRPYLIQALGQQVYDFLSSKPSNVVDLKAIQAVISDFVSVRRTRESQFAFLWDDKTTPESAPDKPEARLSWLGRLILLALAKTPDSSLTLNQIQAFLRAKFEERNLPILENLGDALADVLDELELIFDAVKKEGNRYTFSIPLMQVWFHNVIAQYEDPWQFALERFQQEYKKPRRANKEQK